MPLTRFEYAITHEGMKCPICGALPSYDGELETNHNIITQNIYCGHCGSRWTDIYTLTTYASLVDEHGDPIEIPE